MYSNVKFYQKDNDVHKIHFPVHLEGLMGVNAPYENSNTSNFNEIKIILLMFTGSQDLYLECILIWLLAIGKSVESYISSVNWFDEFLCFRILIISHFPFLITFCIFQNILISLRSYVLDIKFASIILDLSSIINSYNEDVTLLW